MKNNEKMLSELEEGNVESELQNLRINDYRENRRNLKTVVFLEETLARHFVGLSEKFKNRELAIKAAKYYNEAGWDSVYLEKYLEASRYMYTAGQHIQTSIRSNRSP